jgi:hypothetical protein
MTVRATACTALLCALTFANCRAVSLCPGDALCEPRGASGMGGADGGGGRGADTSSAATSAGGTDETGGVPDGPDPPEAGRGGATTSAAGHGGAPSPTAGEGGTNPSEPGDGGTGTCTPPMEDCDDAPLTGCAINLSRDPSHCGRCFSACHGVCSPRGCHEAESFLNQVDSFSSIAMSADYVYLLTGNSIDAPVRLWQVDKVARSERLLADNLPWFEQVTVANGRVYLYGRGENLWSGTEQGAFIDEGFEARSIASSAGVLYADRAGTLLARRETESTWTPQPWMTKATDSVKLWPIEVSNQLCVLRETGDSFAQYELLRVDSPDSADGGLVQLASGSGELVRLRSQNGSVYFLVYEESGLLQLFRRDIRGNTRIEVLATGSRIGDFAVDSAYLYVTQAPAHGYDLDVMSAFGNGDTLRLGIHRQMNSPEADGNHLWFFGWDSLQRVELPLSAP